MLDNDIHQEVTEEMHIACLLYADHVHRNLHYFKCTYNI
jgi:hypothetical protein